MRFIALSLNTTKLPVKSAVAKAVLIIVMCYGNT